MNFKPLLSIIIMLALSQVLFSQNLTKNENGEEIIVYPDGSWEYADEEDIRRLTEETEKVEPAKSLINSDIERAVLIAERAAGAERVALKKEEDLKFRRLLLEDELDETRGGDEYSEAEIKDIKDRLKAIKKEEKRAKVERKKASKRALATAELITMDPEKRKKELLKYDAAIFDDEVVTNQSSSPKTVVRETAPKEKKEQQMMKIEPPPIEVMEEEVNLPSEELVNKNFAKYKPENDVFFNPPKEECNLTFDGIDEFSGKKRKDVDKQLFFAYTNEELRSVFKERDYLTCEGYLSSLSGGLTFLTLNITIASKTAQREYGIIEKGSIINIKLINGDNVRLTSSKTNMGTENVLDNTVTYRAQYLVSSGDEKKLKDSEVDKVRMIWSSGYEDYEVYELDFFMDQFRCLDQ